MLINATVALPLFPPPQCRPTTAAQKCKTARGAFGMAQAPNGNKPECRHRKRRLIGKPASNENSDMPKWQQVLLQGLKKSTASGTQLNGLTNKTGRKAEEKTAGANRPLRNSYPFILFSARQNIHRAWSIKTCHFYFYNNFGKIIMWTDFNIFFSFGFVNTLRNTTK